MQSDPLIEAGRILRKARRIVVFTGAGISAESGIPTFRDDDGLWQAFPPERFATLRGLVSTAVWNPRQFAAFLAAVLGPVAFAWPNRGHDAIAKLQRARSATVITQNVDGLHQSAGCDGVLEIHGSLLCIQRGSRTIRAIPRDELAAMVERLRAAERSWTPLLGVLWTMRPLLGVGLFGFHRPSVVLFGEGLCEPAWTHALDAARSCDAFLTIGTSGVVLPAAMLPSEARSRGAAVIGVGPHDEGGTDLWITGVAAEVLPELVERAI